MGKTYKHQTIYRVHHGFLPWPPYWHSMGIDNTRAKYYYKLSWQRLRHKWTRLLHVMDENTMDKTSLKPENMDWVIW